MPPEHPINPEAQPNPESQPNPEAQPGPEGQVQPEPQAQVEHESGRLSFVLHDHRRPRPHFDLRLEQDGVLKCWAVPRGLPTSPGQNRLAVQVPDHALEHLTYTDADKSIADIGWWELVDRNDRRFVFTLHGSSSVRRYALIQTSQDWLVHLTKEQPDR